MKKTSLALAAVASLGLAAPAMAQNLNYNFIDGRYLDGEVGNTDVDGFGISAQALINPNFYVLGGYSSVEPDNGPGELDVIRAGLGYRHGLAAATDLNGEVLYLNADAGSNDDSGIELGLGLRHRFTEVFEGKAGVRYVDVFNDDDTFVEVGGLAHLTPQFAVGIDYTSGDIFDGFSVGGRFNF